MLNKPIEELVIENGKVVGVKSEGEVRTLNVISLADICLVLQTHSQGCALGFGNL